MKKILYLTYFFVACVSAEPIPVTVWIHGTNAQTLLPFQPERYLKWHTAPVGLHPADTIGKEYNVYTLLDALSHTDPEHFPFEHMYAFGWSGILDSTERADAAHQLAVALKGLLLQYTQEGYPIELTLICHSHGGNVALLTALHSLFFSVPIDRLILLACPVQQETAYLTRNMCFKRIYSFYSTGDLIQVGDPQALHPWRTAITQALVEKSLDPIKAAWHQSRTTPFFSQRSFDLQSNLVNVQLHWLHSAPWTTQDIQAQPEAVSALLYHTAPLLHKPHPILHTEFILPSFVSHIPELIARLDAQWSTATLGISSFSI